ncbi:ubiquitin C-terminal hydrolase L3 [Pholiota conissans]|uniref:Ubiquitin carboxyl-terminal hydrolase n=1 Tax=Pholiota conissans TaxID=109636 RepID=A0A9P6CPZ3_9AGAR|nr:ubiquitin C-terminal hydrolase L3 [Pholiota conissans]
MPHKVFTVLENNPEAMNYLAQELGLSPSLAFHDIYSLSEPSLLDLIPRPALGLLVTIPMTPAWARSREAEDVPLPEYSGVGPDEPVLWFEQTITHACGSIGLLHCLLNVSGENAAHILPGSELARIRAEALPKHRLERAKVLEDSQVLEDAHQRAAKLGQTVAPSEEEGHRLGNHFVAFVKGRDGHLYELEGSRKGPLDRGALADDEDVLSERALDLGLRRVMEIEKNDAGGDLRFSCIVLGPAA